jgi:hypothetical protein
MNEIYQLPKADPEGSKELLQLEAYFDNGLGIRNLWNRVAIKSGVGDS